MIATTLALPTSLHEKERSKRDTNTNSITGDTQCLNLIAAVFANGISNVHTEQPSYINDESTCSTGSSLLDTSGLSGIDKLSLCPWVYTVNSDESRYPVDMMYAQCRCTHCIKTDGSDFDRTHGNQCRQVLYKVKVLRKCDGSCEDGFCTYQPVYEDVPIACTCVRQRTT
ncbi:interleukin-17B-like [Amphiura filiformis]|uniref:interleukin-17B-like n=1 Tax=Amphiura filiformis TaxID=82378 RepID=UPI003B219828